MPKRRLQVSLSEEALAELERRAGAPDKRQQYLEHLLTEGLFAYESLIDRVSDGSRAVKKGKYDAASALDLALRQVDRIQCIHPANQRVGKKCLGCGETL